MRARFTLALAALLATGGGARAQTAATATLEKATTPGGASISFIMLKPEKPVAAVILFAGGHGGLKVKSAQSMGWGAGNFLVRTRSQFAAQNLLVAVIDAPSNRPQGMNGVYRMSAQHAGDIGAVVARLRKVADVPVWLVGTSMGTFSAAQGAIAASGVSGLVLTSTITRSMPDWLIKSSHPDGVASMPLARVKVPVLVVSHKDDACAITPAKDAGKLKSRLSAAPKVEVKILEGGLPPQSDPCEAKSAHGFLGIEGTTVSTIAAFIKANTTAR